MDPPYKIEIEMAREEYLMKYKVYPGARLVNGRTVSYETNDMYKAIHFITIFGAKFL